jgi:hypothetical protein
MNPLRYWKIALGLILVFTAGAVTGSVVTHRVIKNALERSLRFENWTAGAMQVLQTKLKLEPDQHQKIQLILDQTCGQFKTAFSKTLEESGHIIVQNQHRIDQVLTPQQCAIHAEMKRQFRADLKQKLNIDLPEP